MNIRVVSIFFYDIGVRFYYLIILLSSPYNSKARKWINGRKNQRTRLDKLPSSDGNRVWFHCASLGEFEPARPVIERYKSDNKADSIILSFFSPSGYEVRKDYPVADMVVYLPLDTARNAKDF